MRRRRRRKEASSLRFFISNEQAGVTWFLSAAGQSFMRLRVKTKSEIGFLSLSFLEAAKKKEKL